MKIPLSGTEGYRRTLLLIRLIIVFALLISTVFIFFGAASSDLIQVLKYLYYGVAVYLLVILVRIFIRGDLLSKVGSYVQVVADAGFVSLLVYITGLYDSFFSFLYIIVMILGSLELYMAGGFVAGIVSSLFYTALIYLQYKGNLSIPIGDYTRSIDFQEFFVHIMAHDFGFILSGILSGFLGNELKRSKMQVEKKDTDIKQLEDFNQNIIENIESGIMTTDVNKKVTFVNRMALKILGYTRDEILGRELKDSFPGLDFGREKGGAKGKRLEYVFKKKSGKSMFLGFSMSYLKDGTGSEMGMILIFQDLTSVKEMEDRIKLADRMGMLGELAAGLAHEIRNPLASIAGSAQMLMENEEKGSSEGVLLDIIEKESIRLNNLIKDFLTFARPDVKGFSPVNLGELCREVIRGVTISCDNGKKVTIGLDVKDDHSVIGDGEKLKQVMWNLLLNAYQAVDDGGSVDVSVSMGMNGGKKYCSVGVKDDGPGISEEGKKRIFDPFFTTKEGGTGLGLAVSSRIIQIHDGYFELESSPGKGSTFTIYLPQTPAELQ